MQFNDDWIMLWLQIEGITEYSKYERFDELMELIQECGCDLPLTVCPPPVATPVSFLLSQQM